METWCAGWEGAVVCNAYYNEELEEDWVKVELTPWHGRGVRQVLYEGPIGRLGGRGIRRRVKGKKEVLGVVWDYLNKEGVGDRDKNFYMDQLSEEIGLLIGEEGV